MKLAGVAQADEMLDNYEKALSHPDEEDLNDAKKFALEVMGKCQS